MATLTNVFVLSGEIENWWEPETDESFKQKAQCIINQVRSALTVVEVQFFSLVFFFGELYLFILLGLEGRGIEFSFKICLFAH